MREKAKDLVYGITLCAVILFALGVVLINTANARQPKAKFYDFKDQIVDGELKKPSALYTNSRQKVKFNRLLRLKKSFLNNLYRSAKDKVFK